MIKKVFVGVLLAAVFGLLVFGAVNRTLAKTEEREPLALSKNLSEGNESGNGNGQNKDRYLNNDSATGLRGNEGNGIGNGTGSGSGNRNNKSAVDGSGAQNGTGRQASAPGVGQGGQPEGGPADGFGSRNGTGRQGSDSGIGQGGQPEGAPADGSGLGQADVNTWLTETGVIESVSADLWGIRLSDGTYLELEGRALRYLLENGFSVQAGDSFTITGFFDGEKFEIGQVENVTTGATMRVRDENGRPLWAGGRR